LQLPHNHEKFTVTTFEFSKLPKLQKNSKHLKLRASISRAILVGVARTTNLAFRRLQLSAAACVGVPGISFFALRNPFAPAPPRRVIPKPPLLSLSTQDRLRAQLALVLAGSSEESLEPSLLRHASGQECAADGTAVED